ncbi:MAG: TetR/AcrR family transcriptional regulator [Solirubrobacterales bacterium]
MTDQSRSETASGDGRIAIVERILVAAGHEAERVGLDRVRMGEIAAHAGVSRASLYRYFANKDELVRAYTMREFDQLFARIDAVIAPYDSFEEQFAATFEYAIPALRAHPVFVSVLALAERRILRATLQSGEVLGHTRDLVVARINRAAHDGRIKIDQFDAAVTGELLARFVVSLLSTPESIARLDTGDDARKFAERYILPLFSALIVRTDK